MFFFYLSFNCNQSPATKRVFPLFYYTYFNQSRSKKGVFLYFALIVTKALPKKGVCSTFALTLTKAMAQWVFFSIFALILTKAMSQKVFSLFCPYSNQSPTRIIVNEYDQEIPQSQTADNPVAP